jgi:plasmid rolling circle replication initiator protein Rep
MEPTSRDPERENPDQVELDGVQGIEALPRRVQRYGKAKTDALDVAEYMQTIPKFKATADKVATCGDYLVFRHYFTINRVRLHAAHTCQKHLLCAFCAIRRGSKALQAYKARFDAIRAEKPHLRPFLVTLTVKDGPDLLERFKHLHKSQRELWKRKQRGRGSFLDPVEGAVWTYEVPRGSGSGLWHPHIHMIALAENLTSEDYAQGTLGALSDEWHNITGDSFMVNVKPINCQTDDDTAKGFMEVFKYAVKFSDQSVEDTVHAWATLAGKRLMGSAGCFRGVEVPEDLMDDSGSLQDLPYFELFYRYMRAAGGYSL